MIVFPQMLITMATGNEYEPTDLQLLTVLSRGKKKIMSPLITE